MTDKEFRKTRKRIRRIAKQWIEMLGFRWWTVDLEFARDGGSLKDAVDGWESAMCVRVKWEYLQCAIEFNMPACASHSDDKIAENFRHELCHAMIWEMRQWHTAGDDSSANEQCVKHEERVVHHMTSAFGWVYDYGFRAGKEKKVVDKP